jgi:hypothetical protein
LRKISDKGIFSMKVFSKHQYDLILGKQPSVLSAISDN